MGMFSDLMGKLFAHATIPVQQTPAASTPAPSPASVPGVDPNAVPEAAPSPAGTVAPAADAPAAPAAAAQPVDVTAIMDGLAAKSSEHLDWKKSIVDMLKLLGMDSSLTARKELAKDLSYSGDENDSATMNVWLHKAVLTKISENGGKVPAELLG